MIGAKNGAFWVDKDIFFAGQSRGYSTHSQQLLKDASDADLDAYVYKYRFGAYSQCLYLFEGDTRKFTNNLEVTSGDSQVKALGLYTFSDDSKSVPLNWLENYYLANSSRYAGGFSTLNTVKIPRPCAFTS